MRALIVAPSLANSARMEDFTEPPRCASAVKVRGLLLEVCATEREVLSGVHGGAQPGAKRRPIGHGLLSRVSKVGGVGAPGRALSTDVGKHCAVAALQPAGEGWLGRPTLRRVPAEQLTPALAPQPHDLKVVDFS